MDWDEKGVPQKEGLSRWQSELPPETLMAFVASPEAYEVFPPERIWTYVFGPKGGLKPALQVHLADSCDVPRDKKVAGAYYVTYDFSPHEIDYLAFAESAWGNYGGPDHRQFIVHSSEPGVGGPISGRTWDNIVREFYGEDCDFGDGLLTAARGTWQEMWDAEGVLRRRLNEDVVRPLGRGDFTAAARALEAVKSSEQATEEGLRRMIAGRTPRPVDDDHRLPVRRAR